MFQWKRGVRHALVPVVVVIGGSAALAFGFGVADAEKLGEGIGRFAAVAFALGLGISYLAQTGRRNQAIVASVLFGAALAALAVVIVVGASHRTQPLPERDRVPLRATDVAGERRLVHPTLGFSILHPGGAFTESPQMAALMRAGNPDDPTVHYYAYADPQPTAGLIIGIINDTGSSRAAFTEAVRGMRSGLDKQARGAGAVEIVDDQITWDAVPPHARLHAVMAGAHVRLDAYALRPEHHAPVIAVVMVMSRDADALANVRASFRP